MRNFFGKKNKFLFFAAIITIFVILIILLNLVQKEIKNFFYFISAPFQKFFWKIGERMFSSFSVITNANRFKKEVDDLSQKNQDLISKIAQLENLKEENEFLRKALDLEPKKEFQLILVQITGKDIAQDFILINRGLKDGIFKDMPIITSEKVLIGRISEVFKNFSKVMLISNKKSSFDAKILGRDISGLAKGDGRFSLSLDFVPREKDLNKGEKVVTSQLGGIFPPGLLVGEIVEVIRNDIEPFQKAKIKPFFNLKEINFLFGIKD